MKHSYSVFSGLVAILLLTSADASAASSLKVKFTLASGIDRVDAISSTGRVFGGKKRGNSVNIILAKSSVRNASFYGTNGGRFVGPIFSPAGSKGLLFLAASPKDQNRNPITNLSLKLRAPQSGKNYIMIKTAPKGTVFDKRYKYTVANTPSLGLNTPSPNRARGLIRVAALSIDSDGDAVVNPVDVDADGDGVNNMADSNTDLVGGSRVGAKANDSIDIPYTALYLAMNETLNWHINGSLSSSSIDAVIGGENKFSVAFFFGLPPGDTSGITGGHVLCGSSLRYCRPTVGADTGTGVYSGFSEGDQTLPGQLWSNLRADGSEHSLERFSVGDDSAYAASIQPRVGTAYFRAGDNYRVDFTNNSGSVVSSSTLTLPPYFLTVPAIRTYKTTSNDSGEDIAADYSDTSGPGMNSGNPIVLASAGEFSGKLRLTISRLQRLAILPDETGSEYRDYGHLNYGVTINNNSAEYTCGGLYSSLSSSLTEVSSVGSGNSYSTQDGAILWPLVDSSDDYEPSNDTDSTTVGNNTITFTVDLASCLDRNGLSPGVHTVNIFAAGVDTGHGSNRAAQMISVNIP